MLRDGRCSVSLSCEHLAILAAVLLLSSRIQNIVITQLTPAGRGRCFPCFLTWNWTFPHENGSIKNKFFSWLSPPPPPHTQHNFSFIWKTYQDTEHSFNGSSRNFLFGCVILLIFCFVLLCLCVLYLS